MKISIARTDLDEMIKITINNLPGAGSYGHLLHGVGATEVNVEDHLF